MVKRNNIKLTLDFLSRTDNQTSPLRQSSDRFSQNASQATINNSAWARAAIVRNSRQQQLPMGQLPERQDSFRTALSFTNNNNLDTQFSFTNNNLNNTLKRINVNDMTAGDMQTGEDLHSGSRLVAGRAVHHSPSLLHGEKHSTKPHVKAQRQNT